jgi:DNA mismatch endonuclease (patch repair protein)
MWWSEKISATKQRDVDTDKRLRDEGWLVVRVWEHEDPVAAARRIEHLVVDRRSHLR